MENVVRGLTCVVCVKIVSFARAVFYCFSHCDINMASIILQEDSRNGKTYFF